MNSQLFAAFEALRKSIARAKDGHISELKTIGFHIKRFPDSLFGTAEVVKMFAFFLEAVLAPDVLLFPLNAHHPLLLTAARALHSLDALCRLTLVGRFSSLIRNAWSGIFVWMDFLNQLLNRNTVRVWDILAAALAAMLHAELIRPRIVNTPGVFSILWSILAKEKAGISVVSPAESECRGQRAPSRLP
ncbi:hypothetical protein FA95DRAFT_1610865 [Auriscalpium vulgare]|uniref:Uncharacterized protein n=1 Tax=Auriscalpium vulgare TaxID=40419 RepID=A0ACB8RBX9_9AGAM|nr:hypothetical protein FA95DRAFT_1610865 [Auriscalpium vulgare]